MSSLFYSIPVKDIRRETADCISIAFAVPEILHAKFAYQPGQYITLLKTINGQQVRRSYSLCSAPHQKEWRIAVKKVEGGVFSSYLHSQLKLGDMVEAMPPNGNFVAPLNISNNKSYVFVAAGSGITPVISIIKAILHIEPLSHVTLVYGNRNRHSIIFREEIEALKNRYISRFRVIHVLSREITDAALNTGRIDAAKCQVLFGGLVKLQADEYFICGPQDMIFCIKDFLLGHNVEPNKIHFELFTIDDSVKAVQKHKAAADSRDKSLISIKYEGANMEFELDYDGESILDAALHHGLDLPFSCKNGVCTTCKARLKGGQVNMDVNYGLEPEEVEQGFILSCQSHPATGRVVVDFDVK
ncbi:2Fe-2S iron-sulfur cluster-binding protein [Foetidibacter luteolus]|uniref:2Fe-2S iron-sulfur cluster-binding protein n=1 Tax=Foetidibacter luteolus TaxID=2608880 RepID=UPI00129A8244|nr:2Fe-2S iron-sulfur cluster-binding protein [Foetidibacter luteolus]